MDKKTDKGYLYIRANNHYINGIVGTDIKLTFKQKIEIFFSKGISVVLQGNKESNWCNIKYDLRKGCKYLDESTLRCSNDRPCMGKSDKPTTEVAIINKYGK